MVKQLFFSHAWGKYGLDTSVNKICFTLKNHNIYGEKFSNKFKNIKKLDSILTFLNFKTFFHDISLNSHSPTKPK